jgi:transcriptional regulator with XRE-family HTH domain
MATFTGTDLRNFRKKSSMTRTQLAMRLNVSHATVEKWEQHGDQEIRPKYYNSLASLGALGSGIGGAGVVAGLVAAPALVGTAAAVAVGSVIAGGVSGLMNGEREEIKRTVQFLESFRKLTPEEQEQWINICKKLSDGGANT